MVAAIVVDALRKRYGDRDVVDGVTLRIEQGEVYALLGHNGAGKSTTVEILEGYRARDGGDVRVLDVDPAIGTAAWRDRLGIVLQTSGIETSLSVREAIEVYGAPYARRRPLDEVVALAGLAEQADQRIGTLSGGQRRRIDLALGIVGSPDVLFLDEPTTGFDPAARRGAWDVVRQLGQGGTTVLLTTHYLDEAEHLADRVGVIADGRMIAEGTPSELIGINTHTVVSCELPVGVTLADVDGVVPRQASVVGARLSFATATPTGDVHRLCAWAVARDVELAELAVARPSLEDAFLALTADRAEGAS
ncbi:MAG: ABC transporter ATP-binding protein [Desertimonas sp.]